VLIYNPDLFLFDPCISCYFTKLNVLVDVLMKSDLNTLLEVLSHHNYFCHLPVYVTQIPNMLVSSFIINCFSILQMRLSFIANYYQCS